MDNFENNNNIPDINSVPNAPDMPEVPTMPQTDSANTQGGYADAAQPQYNPQPVQPPVQQQYNQPAQPYNYNQPPYNAQPVQPPVQPPMYYQPPINPYQQYPVQKKSSGFAVGSLVLGIISFFISCCWFLSIPIAIVGLILGIVSLAKKENATAMAIVGIVLCAIAGISSVAIVATYLSDPSFQEIIQEYSNSI